MKNFREGEDTTAVLGCNSCVQNRKLNKAHKKMFTRICKRGGRYIAHHFH